MVFGDHLATLEDLGLFKKWLKSGDADYVLEENGELWVGANLKRGVWKWMGESNTEFNGNKLITYTGVCE